MPISLYDAVIPSFRQMLGALGGLLDKGERFCAAQGIAPAEIIDARLAEDMLPFAYQVKSAAVHSIDAIEGMRAGVFSPDMTPPPESFAALRERIGEADRALAALDPAELESFIGRDMRFEVGNLVLPFRAENFLLSFSQPNFYFHVTTAYAILRWKGVEVGKRDYVGAPRIDQAI